MAKRKKLSAAAKKVHTVYEIDGAGFKHPILREKKESVIKLLASKLKKKNKPVMITKKQYKVRTVGGKRKKTFLSGV